MSILENEWIKYRQTVYGPLPMLEDQERQCKAAFMAGAGVMYANILEIGDIEDENEGERRISQIGNDIEKSILDVVQESRNAKAGGRN